MKWEVNNNNNSLDAQGSIEIYDCHNELPVATM